MLCVTYRTWLVTYLVFGSRSTARFVLLQASFGQPLSRKKRFDSLLGCKTNNEHVHIVQVQLDVILPVTQNATPNGCASRKCPSVVKTPSMMLLKRPCSRQPPGTVSFQQFQHLHADSRRLTTTVGPAVCECLIWPELLYRIFSLTSSYITSHRVACKHSPSASVYLADTRPCC